MEATPASRGLCSRPLAGSIQHSWVLVVLVGLVGLPVYHSLQVLTCVGLESDTSQFRKEAARCECYNTTCFSQTINICLQH